MVVSDDKHFSALDQNCSQTLRDNEVACRSHRALFVRWNWRIIVGSIFVDDHHGRVDRDSNGGLVRLFVLPVDELLALARNRVTRNLTEGECHQYLHQEQCEANRNRSNQ